MSCGDVTENGGNDAALRIVSASDTVLSAEPGIEADGERELANGILLRPHASIGATFFGDAEFGVTLHFRDATAGSPAFETALRVDDLVAYVSLGLDVPGTSGASVRVFYDGSLGDTAERQVGGLRAATEF